MHSTDADLSSHERRREIATILAAGILRLMTRPESAPEAALPGAETGSEESPDSAQKRLDLSAPPSPHVPAG